MINIKSLRHIAIVVDNLEKMLDFYQNTLGFHLKKRFFMSGDDFEKGVGVKESSANVVHLEIPNSSITLELQEYSPKLKREENLSKANYNGFRHIAFLVEGIENIYNELKAKGINFVSKPILVTQPENVKGVKFVYFKDIEGNIIELSELPKNN
jgi:catechol 2,3-dioxygenase-like lactoylglutathione lyase family enzyme